MLELLRMAIDRLPPTFSADKKKRYAKQLDGFLKNPKASYEEIQDVIAALGKESWAFRKAYEEMYDRYGRASEEANLLEKLDRDVREKYERFVHEGGKINHIESAKSADDLRNPSPFERYFTPEEKFVIEQALLAARDAARAEIDALVLDKKKDEYQALVAEYKKRQKTIMEKLDGLRKLASVSAKWEPAITDRVRTIEEGWSVVEQGADAEELERETEYWQGTLEAFLHA